MNILASYKWIKEYVPLTVSVEEFAARLSLSGPAIERLYPSSETYEHMIVGKISSIEPHPQADKLRLVMVDIGERTIRVVCGGTNVRVDQWVAVALPGARVRWHGEGDLITLEPATIRGIASEGMICAANEIGLGDVFSHEATGILDLGEALGKKHRFHVGDSLAKTLGVEDDVVCDIEVTTNRPDCMGMVGLAREASAVFNTSLKFTPVKLPKIRKPKRTLRVQVEDRAFCPRFAAVRIDGVKVAPSPWWMQQRLLSAGLRSINNIVDITNYVMLELARPLHAFDANTLEGNLQVRRAREHETCVALDGKTYTLSAEHMVVADDRGVQAIAGIIGGQASGVTADTVSIILESAVFEPVRIRRTARDLQLSTDAHKLYEKGLSTESVPVGLARAIELVLELAGGEVVSDVVDVEAKAYKPLVYTISHEEICRLSGVSFTEKQVKTILERLGFQVKTKKSVYTVTAPWWRDHDIEEARDIVEEVARVYGYAHIEPVYPLAPMPASPDRELVWLDVMRQYAQATGSTEVYTYSFLSEDQVRKGGFDPEHLLKIQNPLSSDFEYMRTSLLPGLLQVIVDNQERFPVQRLHEFSHVFLPGREATGLPEERLEGLMVSYGAAASFREVKGLVEGLCARLGIHQLRAVALTDDAQWHPGQTAEIFYDDQLLATVGRLHPSMEKTWGLDAPCYMAHLQAHTLATLASATFEYTPAPAFPEAKRDTAFVVRDEVTVDQIISIVRSASSLVREVEWFDTYRDTKLPPGTKSLAFHLAFSHPERTLSTEEVDEAMRAIGAMLEQGVGASFRTS